MRKKILPSVFLTTLVLVACGDVGLSSMNSSSHSSITTSDNVSSTSVTSEKSESSETSSELVSSSSSSSVSSSSSSSSAPLTSQDRINLDLASLNYVPGGAMPTFGANGTTISWTSSNPNVISNKGAFVELPFGADPLQMTVSARVSHGGLNGTKTFDLTILPPEPVTLPRVVQLPFVNTSEEYLVTDQPSVDVYFTETGTVPYMDIASFMSMVNGAIDFSLLSFTPNGDELTIAYQLEDEDENGQPLFWVYETTLDFAANTLTVDDFSFFGNYVLATETNFSDGLVFVGGIGYESNVVTIPLGDYRVDLVRKDNLYLAPISVLNLLFLHSLYYDVYYNGDKIYGFDTFTALDAESTVLSEMKTSSFNNLAMAKDLRQSTFHFLALAFDYFYGLKPDKNIVTFYDVLVGYMDRLLTGNDRNLYNGIFSFVYALDDLHSWHEATGFYEPTSYSLSITSLGQLGQNTQNYYTGLWAKEDQIDAAFGAGNMPPSVRLLDNEKIAVIFIRGFNVDTPSDVNAILSTLPQTVERVILDLSFNGGGNVGAVIRLFGYMTEDPIFYSSMNPADGSAATYYYESDYVAYDYDWYIMTSSVTFSAANLMTSMAKEMGVATIIGTQSSGGAASIGLFVTPDGSILLRSTNNVFATFVEDENENRTFTSVEAGVPVDYLLTNTFDDAAIVALINQIVSQNATA